MYGHGTENKHLSLPEHELMLALKTPNVLIRLDGLPGHPGLALPKAIQRDALKGTIEHVDLIEVRQGEKVTVEIPVRVNGDVFPGGVLDQQLVQIAVEAEATHLPDGIDVDVEGMEIGTAVHAKDLALPTGSTLQIDPDTLVLHVVQAQTQAQFEAELGEGAEGAEGETEPVPAAVEGE
jgi:large subunit ribosomal protein L25